MARRKNKKRKAIVGIIILLIAFGTIGAYFCFGKKDKIKEFVKEKKEIEVKPTEIKKLKIVNEDSKSRPYAVMINNINVARPLQSGLQDAYMVYEIIVEGGITRYMALFLDQDTERIGSIRSSRHYYLDYVLENDAIYVHHGQSDQAAADFKALNIDRIVVDNNKTGWRDKSLNVSSEHTLFTSIDKLKNGIGNKRTTRNKDLLLNYSVDSIDMSKIQNVQPANEVLIKYSSATKTSYTYDTENKVYKRFVNGKEHADYVTKEQYTVKNIITYKVNNYNLNDGSGKGRQGLDNIGKGTGYFISEGYAIPITWEKSSRDSKTIYRYENGEELVVNDGNTFIQIQPTNQELSIS